MKKIVILFLTGFLMFTAGCGKKKTAAEIMTEVQNKSAELREKADGLQLCIDGTVAVSMQGITITPKFQMALILDHIADSSNFKGNMQLSMEIMNEKFQMDAWMTDNLMYTDINGELGIEKFNLSELTGQPSSLTKYFENQDPEEFYKDFKVDKTKTGYALTLEKTDFSSIINMIQMLAALGSTSTEDQDALELLQSFDIKKMIFTVNVSKDYILENENLKLEMEMEIEGQKMKIDGDVNFNFEFLEGENVQLPDLSKWNRGTESASCYIEQAGLMSMNLDLSAENDEINKMIMEIAVDPSLLGGVDLSAMDESAKELVKTSMLAQLGISEDTPGLTTHVDFEETMLITVEIDLKTADKEALAKIGLDLENADISFKRFIQTSQEEGYSCTVY